MNAFYVCGSEKTIHITNGEWEPYLSEYSSHYGAASHIVEEAFKLEGIKVVWGFFPWIRSYELAKEGKKWHASAVWWPTNDAKHHFLLSQAVVETSNVFFYLKTNKLHWKDFDDISGFKVGVT